ncbi:BTAD domain-containing putative transcriptional regulator [Actinophytocola sp. NPDC049390]|uniref:AfsR/SARP family transcriptional regulator n=1 Tax=Actinophytocola sp. NPDC049390 TaxID=3363894 RepID=UPI0037B40A68
MEFAVLGPVTVVRGERSEVLSGRLQRILLGVLLARADQPVPVDVLTDALWDGRADPRAAQKLQLHIHRLRGLIGEPDRLSYGDAGYRLRVTRDEVDADRFEALVTAGEAVVEREPQLAVESLRSALALWRGEPFADLDNPLLADWSRRLSERRLTALETLYQAELACGLHAPVIGDLTDLVAEHPLRERLHELLMTALHQAGRQSDALAVYQRARETLVSELGLEPGPGLRALHARVLAGEAPPAPPVPLRHDTPAQVPMDVRGFVGRDAELAELDGLLSAGTSAAIAVVTGTAGVGKTALAVRWAHRTRDRFPDGRLYVDLRGYGPDEPISAADALAGFLRALGLDGAAIPEDLEERAARFRTMVDQRRMLVLLDNARTVEQVRPLLPAGPTCFTLVTSRDALAGLVARYGAHRLGLERLPPADAVVLLRELLGTRAEVEPSAVEALVERCARLPLALRISAELVRARPAHAIGDLVRDLAEAQDALDLLDAAGDPYTAVRAVFSWSYRHLEPAVARVFRLLGSHPGHELDVHALAAMAGAGLRDTRRALGVLVRAHLVDESVDGRYQSHDLLRAYAAELGEATDAAADRAAATDRLFAYYLATASAAMDVIAPHEAERRPKVAASSAELPVFETYDAAFGWLDAERANLLAAAEHAPPEYLVALSDTVWRYLNTGGYHDDAVTLHTKALHAAQSLGDIAGEANARRVLGGAAARLGAISLAVEHLRPALALYERVGDRSLQAATLNNIGVAYWRLGDLTSAGDSFRQALARYRELGNVRMCAPATNNLARIRYTLGEAAEAYELFEESLAISRAVGNRTSETNALCGLAEVCAGDGRAGQAMEYARLALGTALDTGHRSLEGTALRLIGIAHSVRGEHQEAAHHLDVALRIARGVGDTDQLVAALLARAAASAAAGDADAALSWYREVLASERGQAHRDDYAHALAGAADVLADRGDHEEANEHWQRALAIYRELGMRRADAVAARLGRLTTSAG